MNLQFSETSNNNILVKLEGEMDAQGCTHIHPQLEEMTNDEEIKDITLDLQQVNFLDSSGVGVIVFLFKRLKAKKHILKIVQVHGQPLELLSLLRIGTVIPISHQSSLLTNNDE